jgi:hypothetical protein
MEVLPSSIVTKPQKKKVRKLKPSQIIGKKREFIELDGHIGESIGKVEPGTKIFITGRSYSGKSSFVFLLTKLFSKTLKCDYNNHEEKGGDASTVEEKMLISQIDKNDDANINFYKALLHSDDEETFEDILKKKKSAKMFVLDSMQHAKMKIADYIRITDKFCNRQKGKIGVFISHWKKDDLYLHVLHDCDVKLEAMHYVVYVESRLPGATNKPIVLWEKKAREKWGKNYNKVVAGKYWPGKVK